MSIRVVLPSFHDWKRLQEDVKEGSRKGRTGPGEGEGLSEEGKGNDQSRGHSLL